MHLLNKLFKCNTEAVRLNIESRFLYRIKQVISSGCHEKMAVIYEKEDCKEVYRIHHGKIFAFYGAYFFWQLIELTLVPFLFRKYGCFRKRWTLKDWMVNFPRLWGYKLVFPKETNVALIEPWQHPYWQAYMKGYYEH